MIQTRIKRQKPLPTGKAPLEHEVRRNIAWAAGAEDFQYRDPLYHVTESFQLNFDAMGRRHMAGQAGGEAPQQAGEEPEEKRERGARGEERDILQKEARPGQDTAMGMENKDLPDPASSRSFYEMKNPEDQGMLSRFSETAFQRGTMSGAVLRGTGKMMLFSCLKKTIGQSQPRREQQRKLFDHGSQVRNVPGHNPDKVAFNRTFVDSAVGIVVDTLRDARRTVEDIQDLVNGGLSKTEAGAYGADTLRRMYPFLDDSREKQQLGEYYARMKDGGLGPDERGILQNAVNRTHALIDKKARMRTEFMNKLRFLSDRANEALAELEEPGFVQSLTEALEELFVPETPPDDGEPGEGGTEEHGGSPFGSDEPEGDEPGTLDPGAGDYTGSAGGGEPDQGFADGAADPDGDGGDGSAAGGS